MYLRKGMSRVGDMLSQAEIDALLKGTSFDAHDDNAEAFLDENERDALGEIGNISMGTAATTLFTLLGQKVTITTPKITVLTMEELTSQYPVPFVAVEVMYSEGLKGVNLLILQENDVKIITDLMMGGDGRNNIGELTELHLSAISEAMNQMVGSSATSLSEMFHKKIDIKPPKAFSMNFSSNSIEFKAFEASDRLVKISFKMIVGNILDSEIMQIIPINFAKDLVNNLFQGSSGYEATQIFNTNSDQKKNDKYDMPQHNKKPSSTYDNNNNKKPVYNPEPKFENKEPVNVQPVDFPSFDDNYSMGEKENIRLIRDVPLEITVELGRTTKRINEILEFSPGTVVELDKLVGESLDILVNGQYIAKGEVVVIDENYGIRVTDILNPAKRINNAK